MFSYQNILIFAWKLLILDLIQFNKTLVNTFWGHTAGYRNISYH